MGPNVRDWPQNRGAVLLNPFRTALPVWGQKKKNLKLKLNRAPKRERGAFKPFYSRSPVLWPNVLETNVKLTPKQECRAPGEQQCPRGHFYYLPCRNTIKTSWAVVTTPSDVLHSSMQNIMCMYCNDPRPPHRLATGARQRRPRRVSLEAPCRMHVLTRFGFTGDTDTSILGHVSEAIGWRIDPGKVRRGGPSVSRCDDGGSIHREGPRHKVSLVEADSFILLTARLVLRLRALSWCRAF